MKAAVLGASGFVGRAVADALRRNAIIVVPVPAPRIAAEQLTTPQSWLTSAAAERDVRELESALTGSDVVVNCAGLATPGAPASAAMDGANALLPSVVHEIAARTGISRMVHVSSAAVQGDRDVLDETEECTPFSPYGAAKSDGERYLLACSGAGPSVTILRPTSVHGAGRATSASLARLARSHLSSVAGKGRRHSPQVLVQNVGQAVAMLLAEQADIPSIVLQPSEGHTTRSVLEVLGMGREPHQVPDRVARGFVRTARVAGRSSRTSAARRRLSMLWFGQDQVPGWLQEHGFVPTADRQVWHDLGLALSQEDSTARRAEQATQENR